MNTILTRATASPHASRRLARLIAAAGIALALPFALPAAAQMPERCMEGGMGHGMGRDGGLGMHRLHRLNLSEAQQDKVFELMHAQGPLMRERVKALRQAEEKLQALAGADDYSEARARSLADAVGKAHAEMALARVKTERQINAVLTPEQRQALRSETPKDMRPERSAPAR